LKFAGFSKRKNRPFKTLFMKIQKLSGFFLVLAIAFSFTSPVKKSSAKNNLLKSITIAGEITTKYIYNENYKITEIESIHRYQKFYYDENNRLTRMEVAMDPSLLYSTRANEKKKMMTAKNSTITSYDLFEYDKEKHIKKIKHYARKNQDIEFVSITGFIYEGDFVVKCSLTDTAANSVYQFDTFNYDKNGNLINEKNYVNSPPNYYLPKLISETQYKFDDKPTRSSINTMPGRPGYGTNPNNVIETNFILHDTHTKNNTPIITKSLFTYDANGFPLIEKKGVATFEYHYSE